MKTRTNTKRRLSVFAQVCKLIPPHLLSKTMRELEHERGIRVITRALSVWSQVVSLVFCHVGHCLSINDICDSLGLHCGLLNSIRNATPPRRNTLSNANRRRSSEIPKALFYAVLRHFQTVHPGFFARGRRCYFRFPRKLRRMVLAVDSTTIELIAKCINWAKHRKRKAAVKMHMGVDTGSMLPMVVITEPAKGHDANYMETLCAGLKPGDIAVFDKAYFALKHLYALTGRGIVWVTRAKENTQFAVTATLHKGSDRNESIVSDEEVEFSGEVSHSRYPGRLRRVRAWVEDSSGKVKLLTFVTNNLEWAPGTICDLYRNRWAIETFFKEIKQTLQLHTFIGFNRNAIEWQLWSAMIAYLLLRLLAWLNSWKSDFKHFCTLTKGALWCQRPFAEIISQYGTAGRRRRVDLSPTMPYLPGLDW